MTLYALRQSKLPLPRKLSSITWTNCPGLNCVYSGSGSLLTTCKGFLDYENLDLKAYRAERLKVFVAMLGLSASPVLCRVGRNSEAYNNTSLLRPT